MKASREERIREKSLEEMSRSSQFPNWEKGDENIWGSSDSAVQTQGAQGGDRIPGSMTMWCDEGMLHSVTARHSCPLLGGTWEDTHFPGSGRIGQQPLGGTQRPLHNCLHCKHASTFCLILEAERVYSSYLEWFTMSVAWALSTRLNFTMEQQIPELCRISKERASLTLQLHAQIDGNAKKKNRCLCHGRRDPGISPQMKHRRSRVLKDEQGFTSGGQRGFPGGSNGKASACNAGDPGSIPGSGRSSGKGSVNPPSTLAWKIPWTEKPGRLQSMGSQRAIHDWARGQERKKIQVKSKRYERHCSSSELSMFWASGKWN